MIEFPEDFKIMLRELMGEESRNLLEALDRPPVVSVRLNRRKPGARFPDARPVLWCPSGFYLDHRPDFIFDPLLHAGAYYVQDASSMIYESVAAKIVENLAFSGSVSALKVLDLCAAPGGKTTAIINALPDGAFVVANEYSVKRVGPLRENLIKWGYPNVKVSNRDSSFYTSSGEEFDIVAVDAPCSGEGMMRKDEFARRQWSPLLVAQCATLQKEILQNAVKALKPGGFLIYSTCTFNRSENEENAEFINKELGLEPWNPEFPANWNIPGGIDTSLPVFRFMPHKTEGEGLFLALFRKPGEWSPNPAPVYSKLPVPKKSAKKETPEIEDILDVNSDKTGLPRVELNKEKAIAYLRRESVTPPDDAPRGPVIVTYENLNLGLAKNVGNRLNNLYPKNWRILKR